MPIAAFRLSLRPTDCAVLRFAMKPTVLGGVCKPLYDLWAGLPHQSAAFLDLKDLLLHAPHPILFRTYLFFGREEAQRGYSQWGIKGGHFSQRCFQGNIFFIFFLFLSPTLFFFCLVFCNFNLAAKYSCSVLSVTAAQSPGLSRRVTKRRYSAYLYLSFSPFPSVRRAAFVKASARFLPLFFYVMSLSR